MSKIIRAKRKSQFVLIPNKLVQREDMSMQAKGLICYLLSLPDDWVIYKSEVVKHFSNKRTAINTAFNELEKLCYLIPLERGREKGKFAGFDYILHDEPNLEAATPMQKTCNGTDAENQHSPMQKTCNGTDAENQHLQIPKYNKNTNTNTKGQQQEIFDKKIELPFNTETFIFTWQMWKTYKQKEHGFKYKTELSENAALKMLYKISSGNESQAEEIINNSIQNGYRGLFPLKNKPKNQRLTNEQYNYLAERTDL